MTSALGRFRLRGYPRCYTVRTMSNNFVGSLVLALAAALLGGCAVQVGESSDVETSALTPQACEGGSLIRMPAFAGGEPYSHLPNCVTTDEPQVRCCPAYRADRVVVLVSEALVTPAESDCADPQWLGHAGDSGRDWLWSCSNPGVK